MKPDPDHLASLADAVLEGRALDWQELESTASLQARGVIRQFRIIAEIVGVRRRIAVEPPEWWGHLKIEERIGAGTFGEVFRAWDSRLEREVALKLLRSDRDPAAVLREARLLARIRHPNIVTVYDAAEFEGHAGFWMEFIQGQTLEQDVRERGPLTASEVLRLAIELCSALNAVHAAGLLHRDLKAQNVIRTTDGRAVLMDFGATNEFVSSEPDSQQSIGTPLYLAPEVLSGGRGTPLSEIYSLGVLLYRVATGSYPASGSTVEEIRGVHAQGLSKKLLDVRPGFPGDLARLIDHALEPDPGRRMASAPEMAHALERLQRRHGRGHRMLRLAAAASLPLLLAFFVLFQSTWTGQQEEVARDDTKASEAAVPPPTTTALSPPDLSAPAPPDLSKNRLSVWRVFSGPEVVHTVSRDGSLMIFADRTTRGLVVRNLASGEITPLTHKTAGSAREAIISPDGKEVAFFWTVPGVGLEVQIAPLTAETDPRVLHRSASGIALKDWSPDGRSLLVTVMKDGEFHIATLSVEDGSIRDLKSTGRVRPVVAKFSPDGGYIVYDTGPRSAMASDIFVLSADGSQHSAVVQHPANDNSPIWSPDSSRIFYVSHRTATPSLWSVPIKDGKLDGVEEPVRSDVGAITPLAMTPTGILYYGVLGLNRRNIYRVGLKDGKSAETPKVATDRFVNANWGASVSIDGKYLAYYSNRPDTVLAIRDLSNGQERVHPLAIEVNAAFFDRPGWLPEAHSVLLVGRDNPTRPEALYRIDLDNGNPEVVGRTISFEFEVSPDGKSVFSLGAPRYVLSRINLEDGVATGVRPVPYNGGPSTLVGLSLAVSPDATRIAYIHNAEIVVSPVPGDEPRVIFRYPEGNLGNRFGNRMTWSRDDNILFTLEEGSMQSIWRIPSNGGTAEPLGVSINGEIRGPSMHPDGQSLFFTVVEDPINEIWALQNFLPN